jgi:PPOX class probable F420-dependent enzyme
VVVCCYAVQGDRVWTAVDAKPKSGVPLQRLENVRANPRVSLLLDHYEEDWARLWWVRVDGAAAVLEGGDEEEDRAIAALTARYPQYADARPAGPVIALAIERLSGWSAS